MNYFFQKKEGEKITRSSASHSAAAEAGLPTQLQLISMTASPSGKRAMTVQLRFLHLWHSWLFGIIKLFDIAFEKTQYANLSPCHLCVCVCRSFLFSFQVHTTDNCFWKIKPPPPSSPFVLKRSFQLKCHNLPGLSGLTCCELLERNSQSMLDSRCPLGPPEQLFCGRWSRKDVFSCDLGLLTLHYRRKTRQDMPGTGLPARNWRTASPQRFDTTKMQHLTRERRTKVFLLRLFFLCLYLPNLSAAVP